MNNLIKEAHPGLLYNDDREALAAAIVGELDIDDIENEDMSDPPLPTYEVVFSANLYVTLETLDEGEARAAAVQVAEAVNRRLEGNMAQLVPDPRAVLVIHTDDIVRIE